MYSSLAHALSSYMVRSAWTCLIALQLPVLETGAVVFVDDLSEKDLDRPLWKGYSEVAKYDKPYNPGYRVAYGILAEVEEHPFDVNKMVFMD
nr:lycopene beta cyclase, chloroplastic/chromoplastic [Quercus suber]